MTFMSRKKTEETKKLFTAVINEYGVDIYALCRSFYPGDIQRSDSLYNDIVYRLWLRLEDYRPIQGIDMGAWVMKVARNAAISCYRHERFISRLFRPLHKADNNVPDISDNELVDELYTLIDNLPPADKQLVNLYIEHLSIDEIAAQTGLTSVNVRVKINRIKHKLKQMHDEEQQ